MSVAFKAYFKNLDVKQSVLLLSLTISFVFVAVGVLSLQLLMDFGKRYEDLKNNNLRATAVLHSVDSAFLKLRLSAASYSVARKIPKAQRHAFDADMQKIIDDGNRTFAKMADTATEVENFDEWNSHYVKFLAIRAKQIELLENGKEQEFVDYRIKVAIPHNRKSDEILDRLIAYQSIEATEKETAVAGDVQQSQLLIASLLTASVILTGVLIWFSVNGIARVQRERVEALNKSATLGSIAGDIAHEINSPLAVILGSAELLAETIAKTNADPERVKKLVDKISTSSARIQKITSGMRAFARDGSVDPFVEFKLRNMLEESLALCSDKLKRHAVPLEFDFPAEELSVEGRAVELSQVIVNLVGNSVDAISQMDDRWIRLHVSSDGDDVVMAISDSGRGIPISIREKMFKTSFTTKPVGEGTGLGLGICARIVSAHHGKIQVDSAARNTRIVMTLPKLQPKFAVGTAA